MNTFSVMAIKYAFLAESAHCMATILWSQLKIAWYNNISFCFCQQNINKARDFRICTKNFTCIYIYLIVN
jgi:hypothetical protein